MVKLEIQSFQRSSMGDNASKQVDSDYFSIGRDEGNDWILPDSNKIVSKRHCYIKHQNNQYYLVDISSNGSFVNDFSHQVGRNEPRELHSGDILYFGEYEILFTNSQVADGVESHLSNQNASFSLPDENSQRETFNENPIKSSMIKNDFSDTAGSIPEWSNHNNDLDNYQHDSISTPSKIPGNYAADEMFAKYSDKKVDGQFLGMSEPSVEEKSIKAFFNAMHVNESNLPYANLNGLMQFYGSVLNEFLLWMFGEKKKSVSHFEENSERSYLDYALLSKNDPNVRLLEVREKLGMFSLDNQKKSFQEKVISSLLFEALSPKNIENELSLLKQESTDLDDKSNWDLYSEHYSTIVENILLKISKVNNESL